MICKHVLTQFPAVEWTGRVASLTVGGFSGAEIWRLETPCGGLCLRAWPPGMRDHARLAWLHQTLKGIFQHGCRIVPVPLETTRQTTWVDWQDRFWDVSPWLPGRADYSAHATPERLRSALRTLAEFHLSAARVLPPGVLLGPSPALCRRELMLSELHHGLHHEFHHKLFDRLCDDACQGRSGSLKNLADQILRHYRRLAPGVAGRLQSFVYRAVPLQVCHGDLWHDHLLFVGERVSGLIDFGNLRVDSPSSDVARLLGSLVGDDSAGWRMAVEAYEQVHPLRPDERAVLRVFDQTTVLLSGINWLKWIYLERRQFASWSGVEQRLSQIVTRLSRLRDA